MMEWFGFPARMRLDRRLLRFPDPARAEEDGLLAVGGDLSPERLLVAYRQGIFPWYEPGGPILWWCPNPRMILEPDGLKVSRSLRATIRRELFSVRFDTAFPEVIRACATAPRAEGPGSWITPEVEAGYTALFQQGYAHSVESWQDGELVGGLYGVLLGRCFFGESMFARRSDASKVAVVAMVEKVRTLGVTMIDCQVASAHLASLGATEIPRPEFLDRLAAGLADPIPPASWAR